MASKIAEAFLEVRAEDNAMMADLASIRTRMTRELTSLQSALTARSGRLGDAMLGGLNGATKGVRGTGRLITHEMEAAQKSVGSFAANFVQSMGLIAGGMVILQGGKAVVAFEQNMTNAASVMDGAKEHMSELRAVARDSGIEFGIAADKMAEGFYFLGQAGMNAEQSLTHLPAVAEFATAGNFDLAKATDMLMVSMGALEMQSDDSAQSLLNMRRIMDVITQGNIISTASVEQFAEALSNKGGNAIRVLGKELEEGVAVLAAFAKTGLRGMAAGEALDITFRDLGTSIRKQPGAWKKLGVAVYDAGGDMMPIADILQGIEEKTRGMSDEMYSATLAQLGFQDKSVKNIKMLLGQSDAIRKYQLDLENAGGATKRIANDQMQGLGNQLNKLKAALVDIAITIMNPFLKGLNLILQPLAKFFVFVSRLPGSLGEFTLKMAGASATVVALAFAVYKLHQGFKVLEKAYGKILKSKLALIFYAAAIAAVALYEAIEYMRANWESLPGPVRDFAEGVITAFNYVKAKAIEVGQYIYQAFGPVWERIKSFAKSAMEVIIELFSGSDASARVAGKGIMDVFMAFVDVVAGAIKGAIDVAVAMFTAIYDIAAAICTGINESFTAVFGISIPSLLGKVLSFFMWLISSMIDGLSLLTTSWSLTWQLIKESAWYSILWVFDKWITFCEGFSSYFLGACFAIIEIFKNLVSNIWKFFLDIGTAAKATASGIAAVFSKLWSSPSTFFKPGVLAKEFGKAFDKEIKGNGQKYESLGDGVAKGFERGMKVVDDFTANARAARREALGDAGDNIESTISAMQAARDKLRADRMKAAESLNPKAADAPGAKPAGAAAGREIAEALKDTTVKIDPGFTGFTELSKKIQETLIKPEKETRERENNKNLKDVAGGIESIDERWNRIEQNGLKVNGTGLAAPA